jgi:hypothetical protein
MPSLPQPGTIKQKLRNSEGQPMSRGGKQLAGRALNRKFGQRGKRFAPPQSPSSLVAEQMRLQALTPGGAELRQRFGQLGRPENLKRPAHRLSPRMSRRLRRRSVVILGEVMRAKQVQAALEAVRARAAERRKPTAEKEQCHARTKLGAQCRKKAVADGYCATHGG